MMPNRTLTWGIHPSFVGYVESFGGAVSVDHPAARISDGRFRFPEAFEEGAVTFFAGRVRFAAHGGLLDVLVSRPGLRRSAGSGGEQVLSIDALPGSAPAASARMDLALIDAEGNAILLPTGLSLFEFRYPAGHPLDPPVLTESPLTA